MTSTWWLLLLGLSLLGYGQRALPWIMVRRFRLPQGVAQWLRQLAPAAFASLMVQDMARLSALAFLALAFSFAVGSRTRSLGLTVLAGVAVGVLSRLPGWNGL